MPPSSPFPPAPPGPNTASGVLMLTGEGQLGGTTTTEYHVYVIGVDGRILRSATGSVPSVGSHLPRLSVAGDSVYFIDGDRDLKVLHQDGSVARVGQLPGGPADRVVFAVSPDEQQIAYSVLHYGSPTCSPDLPCQYPPTTTSLRVGRLDGVGVREIFSSASVTEYPIGWLNGRLLISVTPYAYIQNPGEVNPYFATDYHLADAQTATRSFDITPACGDESARLEGPVNARGTVCREGGSLLAVHWDGTTQPISSPADVNPPAVLSPDGRSAAASIGADHKISILSGSMKSTGVEGTPAGWFDERHLMFMTGASGGGGGMLLAAGVLNLTNNSVIRVTGLVGSADPYAPFFATIPNAIN